MSVARRVAAFACVIGLGATQSVAAQEVSVPVRLQYALFTKILSFDRNLAARSNGELVIGVVYQSGFRASRAVADEFFNAFAGSAVRSISGIPIRLERIPLTDPTQLADALAAKRVTVVYLAPLRATAVGELVAGTTGRGMLSISGVREYVRAGVAVGVEERSGKPGIVINLPRARAEGADFGAQLLALAEVIR